MGCAAESVVNGGIGAGGLAMAAKAYGEDGKKSAECKDKEYDGDCKKGKETRDGDEYGIGRRENTTTDLEIRRKSNMERRRGARAR